MLMKLTPGGSFSRCRNPCRHNRVTNPDLSPCPDGDVRNRCRRRFVRCCGSGRGRGRVPLCRGSVLRCCVCCCPEFRYHVSSAHVVCGICDTFLLQTIPTKISFQSEKKMFYAFESYFLLMDKNSRSPETKNS